MKGFKVIIAILFLLIVFANCRSSACTESLGNFVANKSTHTEHELIQSLDSFINGRWNDEEKELFENEFASWFDLLTKCYSAPQVVTA